MHKEAAEELRVRLKLEVLEYASHLGVTKACREFNVPRSTFNKQRIAFPSLCSGATRVPKHGKLGYKEKLALILKLD